jgi:primosomal protein N' (replication factor Y)
VLKESKIQADISLCVEVAVSPLSASLTYLLPAEMQHHVSLGHCVEVPLGRRKAQGFVVSAPFEIQGGQNGFKLKPVTGLLRPYPVFDQQQLAFFQWIAQYYLAPISLVIEVALPAFAPEKVDRLIKLLRIPEANEIKGGVQKKIIEMLISASRQAAGEKEHVLAYSEIARKFRNSASSLKKLQEKGLIKATEHPVADSYILSEKGNDVSWAQSEVCLSEPQSEALKSISKFITTPAFKTFLLHGVTGSGKTEVYIELIKEALALGKSALIIVPEIALTPQLFDRFTARLGNNIAVLHSGLSKRARWDAWRALLEGRCMIALGARSGIFAPLRNAGIIIVDEEHDSSFKQSDGLRYNARDLALMRGKMESVPVVLGSATPSLESYYRAKKGDYHFLSIPNRYSTWGPARITPVDLNKISRSEMLSRNISVPVYEALHQVLSRNEQAFVLYNRRGFATYLQCSKCEHVIKCPNCDVTLTYHKRFHSLMCHYCNLRGEPPRYCPDCLKKNHQQSAGKNPEAPLPLIPGTMETRGGGTETVFEEIEQLFPNAIIDRLDRDVANSEHKYRTILNRVRKGESQILVGTQMIAKGHDLPNVTLVVVIDCDVGLHLPDFRAAEKAYQLLTQVAGRSGRGDKEGRVLLQTRLIQHPSIQKTIELNFEGFARQELLKRKALKYPPYSKMLRIIVQSSSESLAHDSLHALSKLAQAKIERDKIEVRLLGPAPAPIKRIKARYRYHLLLRSASARGLNAVARHLQAAFKKDRKVQIIFDMDAQDML